MKQRFQASGRCSRTQARNACAAFREPSAKPIDRNSDKTHGIKKWKSTAVRYFNVGCSAEDIEPHNPLALTPNFRNTKRCIDGKLIERSAGKFGFHDNIRRRIALDIVLLMSPDYRRCILH